RSVRRYPQLPRGRSARGYSIGGRGLAHVSGRRYSGRTSARGAMTLLRSGRLNVSLDMLASGAVMAVIVATMIFLVLPIAVTVLMAMDSRPFMGTLPPPSLTTKWFAEFFRQREYFEGVKTTLIVGTIAMAFSTLAGVLYAVAYARFGDFPGRK